MFSIGTDPSILFALMIAEASGGPDIKLWSASPEILMVKADVTCPSATCYLRGDRHGSKDELKGSSRIED